MSLKNPSSIIKWTEKYRPKCLDDVVGSVGDHVRLCVLLDYLPNMIFCGPPGCGKTTIAKNVVIEHFSSKIDQLPSKQLQTQQWILTKIPPKNQEEYIENTIGPFCRQTLIVTNNTTTTTRTINLGEREKRRKMMVNNTPPPSSVGDYGDGCGSKWKKIVIVEEADAIPIDSQITLLYYMEVYGDHVTFLFLCNHESKLINEIVGKCMMVRFNPIGQEDMREIIHLIIEEEQLEKDDRVVPVVKVVKYAHGDARRAIHYLQHSFWMHDDHTTTTTQSNLNMNNFIESTMTVSLWDKIELFTEMMHHSGYILAEFVEKLVNLALDGYLKKSLKWTKEEEIDSMDQQFQQFLTDAHHLIQTLEKTQIVHLPQNTMAIMLFDQLSAFIL